MNSQNTRKKFPINKIIPKSGTLEAIISGNSFEQIDLDLEYSIRIELLPFTLENESWDTEINLWEIPLKVKSWKVLSKKKFKFPKYPATATFEGIEMPIEPHVEGSLHLFNTHNTVRVGKINFKKISSHKIPVVIDMEIEFSSASGYEPAKFNLQTELIIGPVSIRGDIAKYSEPSFEDACKIAEEFLDLDDYNPPVIERLVKFYPKNV
jgi:hypothetical protein